ncbi:MAG: diacylglycerol/polyprenol kinase family protein [Woeseiaceae bacterium]
MESSLLAIVLPPLTLVPVMGLLSRARSGGQFQAELRRKAFHVSIGCMSLFLPLVLTETWLIIVASTLTVVWMLAARHAPCIRSRFGGVLHDANRRSYGELYFTLSIALLLLLAGDEPLLYVTPVLILSFADAAAALVGKVFPVGRLSGPASGKTMSGCAAFFLTAFVISLVAITVFLSIPFPSALSVAFLIAIVSGVMEAVSTRGLDNLTVPLSAYLVMNLFISGV